MKNNYPIVYAVIPMIEQVGWSHGLNELEREYGTVCYIVSKCYLVGEEKKYKQNGEAVIKYKVVPPYLKNFDLGGWSRTEPCYNGSGECYDCFYVNDIFNNFEEATAKKNKMNDILFHENYFNLSKIDEERKKFDKTLNFYNGLEVEIEKNLTNLQINIKNKEQRFLLYKNGEISEEDIPLYEIIDYSLYDYDNYIVYTISEEEYKKLKKNKQVNIKKYTHTPLIRHEKSSRMIEIVSSDESDNVFLKTGRNKTEVKKSNNLDFPEEIDRVIFTLEDYTDIMESYGLKTNYKKILTLK